MDNQQPNSGLNSTQKTGFVLLLVFGIMAVGLGFLQMRNNIYNPFAISIFQDESNIDSLLDEQTRLQMIDTDHDGINDWEELNFYETSPYLPDTDSDGAGDKEEIDGGTNPTCAENKGECQGEFGNEKIEKDIIYDEVNISELDNTVGDEVVVEEEVILTSDTFSEMLSDPDKIRELLLSTGQISEDQLAELSDDVLVATLTNILQQESEKQANLIEEETL